MVLVDSDIDFVGFGIVVLIRVVGKGVEFVKIFDVSFGGEINVFFNSFGV